MAKTFLQVAAARNRIEHFLGERDAGRRVLMSTTGLCPLTVTDSSMAQVQRETTRALKPTVSRRSSRIDAENR